MTANLTSQYYATSRDFLVIDTSRPDIAAIGAVFDADYAHHASPPAMAGSGLVADRFAGQTARAHQRRHHSLRIYSEEMGDATIEKALIAAAKRGVDVQVTGENRTASTTAPTSGSRGRGARQLLQLRERLLHPRQGGRGRLRHSRAKVFIGSENFSSTSLNRNRELGLIISSRRHVRHRQRLQHGLPERPALGVAGMAGLQRYSPALEGSDFDILDRPKRRGFQPPPVVAL